MRGKQAHRIVQDRTQAIKQAYRVVQDRTLAIKQARRVVQDRTLAMLPNRTLPHRITLRTLHRHMEVAEEHRMVDLLVVDLLVVDLLVVDQHPTAARVTNTSSLSPA